MPAIDVLSPEARRTLLDVLASVAAADGVVADDEHCAFRGACIALGQPQRRLEALDLDRVALGALTPREVMLTYSAAAWMALADGVQLRAESLILERLRARLRLDRDTARVLAKHARWVRASTDLPWHRELEHLLVHGARRLDQLEHHASARFPVLPALPNVRSSGLARAR